MVACVTLRGSLHSALHSLATHHHGLCAHVLFPPACAPFIARARAPCSRRGVRLREATRTSRQEGWNATRRLLKLLALFNPYPIPNFFQLSRNLQCPEKLKVSPCTKGLSRASREHGFRQICLQQIFSPVS